MCKKLVRLAVSCLLVAMVVPVGGKLSQPLPVESEEVSPDGPVTGVVVAAVGRTGSTLISRLFR